MRPARLAVHRRKTGSARMRAVRVTRRIAPSLPRLRPAAPRGGPLRRVLARTIPSSCRRLIRAPSFGRLAPSPFRHQLPALLAEPFRPLRGATGRGIARLPAAALARRGAARRNFSCCGVCHGHRLLFRARALGLRNLPGRQVVLPRGEQLLSAPAAEQFAGPFGFVAQHLEHRVGAERVHQRLRRFFTDSLVRCEVADDACFARRQTQRPRVELLFLCDGRLPARGFGAFGAGLRRRSVSRSGRRGRGTGVAFRCLGGSGGLASDRADRLTLEKGRRRAHRRPAARTPADAERSWRRRRGGSRIPCARRDGGRRCRRHRARGRLRRRRRGHGGSRRTLGPGGRSARPVRFDAGLRRRRLGAGFGSRGLAFTPTVAAPAVATSPATALTAALLATCAPHRAPPSRPP
jgi:hypothetical protein